MNLYLFEDIEKVSNNYHDGGGLVIVAKDKRAANKEVKSYNKANQGWRNEDPINITEKEWKTVIVYKLDGEHKPKVYPFPDAGCC